MSQKKPTLSDVATAARASKSAVSRVLNDEPGVAPQTRERVRKVIAALGYRPDPVARALASGRNDVLDLVVVGCAGSFGDNSYFNRVTAGVVQETADTDAHLRVHVIEDDEAPALLERIADSASLGALLVNVAPALVGELYARYDRVVVLGRSAEGVPSVDPENTEGAYAAVRHLQQTGRRRIAAIHGPVRSNTDAAARRDGYQRAMREAGLPEVTAEGTYKREQAYDQTVRLLAEHPDLDAFFVASDLMATGVMQALADLGRRVPQDVAVVGFDDSLIAACTSPPLSSVHQPVEQMAAAATRALLDGRTAPYWRCVFPTTLHVRGSSAALTMA
ncbi:LacI family DNA-binding transcriptional regulator [Actinoplanes sp. NPDC051494]|uniref:LacI family DNA-binding transcriptional regulator n=1 Tax=Actinoplanes sp. NPDC051494 TaxID=3363907 RepID=UPI003794D90B